MLLSDAPAGSQSSPVWAVAGTDTEVGKTWVAAQALAQWRTGGRRVAARKPVQSFSPGEGPTDAEVLAEATGESPQQVCPPSRWYEVPMAPPMAADVLGRPAFTVADLVAELAWPPDGRFDVGLVETVGGVRAPIAADGDSLDLIAAVGPTAVLLVAHAGLGTVNHVRLSVAALARVVPAPVVVFLNRFDPADDLHRRNRDWLAHHDGLDVRTSIPELDRS